MIAKCGDIKLHHWAHKGKIICDPWWENETEWHRSWKNNYEEAWQEIALRDEVNNEVHIADVRTADNLVIEFQYSYISTAERISREKFYKKMIWVVDGSRRKTDYSRFIKGMREAQRTNHSSIFNVHFPDECFNVAWIGSSVPVVFDFKGNATFEDANDPKNHLYCLLPQKEGKAMTMVALSRLPFINVTTSGEWSSKFIRSFHQLKQLQPIQHKSRLQKPGFRRTPSHILHRGKWVRRRRF
jgi:hypothetical protein